MSRKHPGGHVLPDNPTWIDFPRSDGNTNQLPKNTTKIVDGEGQVNYMRPVGLDESLAIMWRVSVGAALAPKLGYPGEYHAVTMLLPLCFDWLQEGPKYVLKSWPTGYQFFDHNKGPVKNPRHDAYLIGMYVVSNGGGDEKLNYLQALPT